MDVCGGMGCNGWVDIYVYMGSRVDYLAKREWEWVSWDFRLASWRCVQYVCGVFV